MDFFFRGLMTSALMGLGWVMYMYKISTLIEDELLMKETISKRKQEKEMKQREFEIGKINRFLCAYSKEYQKAVEQADKEMLEFQMQQKREMEAAFEEAKQLNVFSGDSDEEGETNPSQKLDSTEFDQFGPAATDLDAKSVSGKIDFAENKETSVQANEASEIIQESAQILEPKAEITTENETEAKEPKTKQSEEFWDYSKKTKEQIQCYEDGEALNSLFEDKHECLRVLEEKQERKKAEEQSKIVLNWPNIPSANFKRSHTLPTVASNPETTQEIQGEQTQAQDAPIEMDQVPRVDPEVKSDPFSMTFTMPIVKKPWMR